MAMTEQYQLYVEDQLSELNNYTTRKMFGGLGFFYDGIMFGAIMDDVFRLKADETTIPNFTEFDCGPHQPRGKKMTMPYYEVPTHIMENKSALKEWSLEAIEVALRKRK